MKGRPLTAKPPLLQSLWRGMRWYKRNSVVSGCLFFGDGTCQTGENKTPGKTPRRFAYMERPIPEPNGSACRQHVPKAFLIDRHDDPGFLASLRPVVGIGQRLSVGWPEFRVHVHGACTFLGDQARIRIAAASTSQTYWLKALSLANCYPAYVDSKSFFISGRCPARKA